MARKLERSALEFVPIKGDLEDLKEAAEHCRGCDLYKHATQTVFGEGKSTARIVLVGEQPGDQEDRQGRPFVGPAGKLLNRALKEVGIEEKEAYVTNVVKHFKFEPRGKRRLHKTPREIEVRACYPWLLREIDEIEPEIIVCLGATAAKAMLGNQFRITKQRGQFFPYASAPWIMATVHPSSILRAPDDEARHQAFDDFKKDLDRVAYLLKHGRPPG